VRKATVGKGTLLRTRLRPRAGFMRTERLPNSRWQPSRIRCPVRIDNWPALAAERRGQHLAHVIFGVAGAGLAGLGIWGLDGPAAWGRADGHLDFLAYFCAGFGIILVVMAVVTRLLRAPPDIRDVSIDEQVVRFTYTDGSVGEQSWADPELYALLNSDRPGAFDQKDDQSLCTLRWGQVHNRVASEIARALIARAIELGIPVERHTDRVTGRYVNAVDYNVTIRRPRPDDEPPLKGTTDDDGSLG
jgi:hypothetical protein